MWLISNWLKRLAVKSYVYRLGRRLRKRYGWRKTYSPDQIRSEITRAHMSQKWQVYAMAMYAHEVVFKNSQQGLGIDDYERIRDEVGNEYFAGDSSFTVSDILRYSAENYGRISGSKTENGDTSTELTDSEN